MFDALANAAVQLFLRARRWQQHSCVIAEALAAYAVAQSKASHRSSRGGGGGAGGAAGLEHPPTGWQVRFVVSREQLAGEVFDQLAGEFDE